jgi:hypothetical protein
MRVIGNVTRATNHAVPSGAPDGCRDMVFFINVVSTGDENGVRRKLPDACDSETIRRV